MGSSIQDVAQTIVGTTAPPVIHSEPNALYEEICHRLERYNSQIEKLNTELKKFTLMRDVLAAAQNAFDRDTSNDGERPKMDIPY